MKKIALTFTAFLLSTSSYGTQVVETRTPNEPKKVSTDEGLIKSSEEKDKYKFNGLNVTFGGMYNKSEHNLTFGVGYDKTLTCSYLWPDLYVGGFGDYSYTGKPGDSTIYKDAHDKTLQKNQRINNIGAHIKIGKYIDHSIAYGFFFAGFGQKKYDSTREVVGGASTTQEMKANVTVFGPGIGAQYKVSKHISLGIDARYIFEHEVDKASVKERRGLSKDRYGDVRLKVAYHF